MGIKILLVLENFRAPRTDELAARMNFKVLIIVTYAEVNFSAHSTSILL